MYYTYIHGALCNLVIKRYKLGRPVTGLYFFLYQASVLYTMFKIFVHVSRISRYQMSGTLNNII